MNTLQNLKKQIAKIREQKDPIIKQLENKIESQEQIIKKLTEKLIHFQDRQMCNRISYLQNSGYIWKSQEGQSNRKFLVIDVSSLQPQFTFISNSSVKFIKHFEAYLFNKANNQDVYSNIGNSHFQKFIQQIQALQNVVTRLRTQMDDLKKKYQEDIHQGFAIVNPNSRTKVNLNRIPTLSTPDIMVKQTFSFNSEQKKEKQSFDLGIPQINSHTMKQQVNSLHLSNQEIDKNTLIKQSSLPPSPNSDPSAHNLKSKIGGSDGLRSEIVQQQQQSDQQSRRISKHRKSKKKEIQNKQCQKQQTQQQVVSNGYYGQLKPKSKIKNAQLSNAQIKQIPKQEQNTPKMQQQELKLTGYIQPYSDGLKTKKIQKKHSQKFTGLQTQRIQSQKTIPITQNSKVILESKQKQNNVVNNHKQNDQQYQGGKNKQENRNLHSLNGQIKRQQKLPQNNIEQKNQYKSNLQQRLKPYLKQLPMKDTEQVKASAKQQLKQERQINIDQKRQELQNKPKERENQTSIQSSIVCNKQSKISQNQSKQSQQSRNGASQSPNKLLNQIQVKIPQPETKSVQAISNQNNDQNIKKEKMESEKKDAIKWIDSNQQIKSLTASPQLHPFLINQNSSIQLKLNKIPSEKQEKQKLQNFNLNIPEMKSIQQIDEDPIAEQQIKNSDEGVFKNQKQASQNNELNKDKQSGFINNQNEQTKNQVDLSKAVVLQAPQQKQKQAFVPKTQHNYVSQLSEISQISSNSVTSKIESMNQQMQTQRKNTNEAYSDTHLKNQIVFSEEKQESSGAIPIKLTKQSQRKSQTIAANPKIQLKDIDKKHSMIQIPNKSKQMLSSIKQEKQKEDAIKKVNQAQLNNHIENEQNNQAEKLKDNQLQDIYITKKNKNQQINKKSAILNQSNKQMQQNQIDAVKENQNFMPEQKQKQLQKQIQKKAPQLAQNIESSQKQISQQKNDEFQKYQQQNASKDEKQIKQLQARDMEKAEKNRNEQQIQTNTTVKQNKNELEIHRQNKQNQNIEAIQKTHSQIKNQTSEQNIKQQVRKQQSVENVKNISPQWSSLFPTYIHNDKSSLKQSDNQKQDKQQQSNNLPQRQEQTKNNNNQNSNFPIKQQIEQNKNQKNPIQQSEHQQIKNVEKKQEMNKQYSQKNLNKQIDIKIIKKQKQDNYEQLMKQTKQAQIEQQQQLDRLLEQINQQQNRERIKRLSLQQKNQGKHFSNSSTKKDEGLNQKIKELFTFKSQDKSRSNSRKQSGTGNDKQRKDNDQNSILPNSTDKVNEENLPNSPVKYSNFERFGLQNSTQYDKNDQNKTPSELYNFRAIKSQPYSIQTDKNQIFLESQHNNQESKQKQHQEAKVNEQNLSQKNMPKQIVEQSTEANLPEQKTSNFIQNTTPSKEITFQSEQVNKTPITKQDSYNQKSHQLKQQAHNMMTPVKSTDLKSEQKKKSKSKVIYFRKG